MTSSNGNIFRITGHLCGEFTMPVTRSFEVFFDLHPNKRLSKRSWGWWFETPSRPLWRHCNVKTVSKRSVLGWILQSIIVMPGNIVQYVNKCLLAILWFFFFFYAVNKNVCSRSLNSLRFWCTKYFEIKCQACRNIKRSLQNYSIQFQLIWLWSHRMLNRWSLLFNIPKICFFSDHIPWKIFPNYKHFLRRIHHWYIPVAKGQ